MARAAPKPPYTVLANFFDQLTAVHAPLFAKARQEILGPLLGAKASRGRGSKQAKAGGKLQPQVRVVCDLCAGTGTLAMEFARRGLRVYAVDRSADMVRVARAKVRRARFPVRVIRADARNFRLPEPVDLITCQFDAINHLARKRDLVRVARAVGRALRPGGWFLVDANTTRSFKEVWILSWVAEGKGFFLATRGGYDRRRDRAWGDFDWFVPAGRLWRRFTERYQEIAWSDGEFRLALAAGGLRVRRTWDQMEFVRGAPWLKPGCRIFYLAQKK